MAIKIDLVAPPPPVSGTHPAQGNVMPSSAMMLQRWFKQVGDKVIAGEPLIELVGNQMVFYVHAPGNGTLSSMNVVSGQNVLSGHVLGQISAISADEIDWENLDQVTAILGDYLEKAKDFKSIKDSNEALGQLLGVDENPVFFNMSTEEQNHFLQGVVDQYQANQLSPADMARKLLEGLELRTPQYAPQGPAGPALGFGMRGPAPAGPGGMGGGMGGGMRPTAYPPQQAGAYQPNNTMPPGYYDPQAYGQNPYFGGGAIPQPNAYPSYPVSPAPHHHPHQSGLVPPSDYYPAVPPQYPQQGTGQIQEQGQPPQGQQNPPLPPSPAVVIDPEENKE